MFDDNSEGKSEDNHNADSPQLPKYSLKDFMMEKDFKKELKCPPPTCILQPLPFSNSITRIENLWQEPNIVTGKVEISATIAKQPYDSLRGFIIDKNYRNQLTFAPPTSFLEPLPISMPFQKEHLWQDPYILTSEGKVVEPKVEESANRSSDSNYTRKRSCQSKDIMDTSQHSTEMMIHPPKRKVLQSNEIDIQSKGTFARTVEASEELVLQDISIKTSDLLKRNRDLESHLAELRQMANEFLGSVLNNQENQHIQHGHLK